MWVRTALLSLLALAHLGSASPYREDLVDYNLNTNQNAKSPTEYSTTKRTSYTASPTNWRAIPFYTILMDKFADGDPSNNDYFQTMYEWDWRETQLRAGGDLKGMVAKLDYLQGMGIKGIFVSGTPFINMLWQADSEFLPPPSGACLVSPSRFRLFPTRLHRPRPPLGHPRRLARCDRRDPLPRNVLHGGFHGRYHGGSPRLRRVRRAPICVLAFVSSPSAQLPEHFGSVRPRRARRHLEGPAVYPVEFLRVQGL